MEQRWSRFDRVGQEKTVQAFAFREATRTIDYEEDLLRRYKFVT